VCVGAHHGEGLELVEGVHLEGQHRELVIVQVQLLEAAQPARQRAPHPDVVRRQGEARGRHRETPATEPLRRGGNILLR
jgi:hypothetical protein